MGFFSGHDTDMRYTGPQTDLMGAYMGMFNQPDNYHGTRKRFRQYNQGRGDTSWMQPLMMAYGRQGEDAVQQYGQQNAAGFNQGGGALAAAGSARLLNENARNSQQALAGAYTQHGQDLYGQMMGAQQMNEDRRFEALRGATGIAQNPYENKRTGGFWNYLGDNLRGTVQAAAGSPGGIKSLWGG